MSRELYQYTASVLKHFFKEEALRNYRKVSNISENHAYFYLFQELKKSSFYSFDWFVYGPYSPMLQGIIRSLSDIRLEDGWESLITEEDHSVFDTITNLVEKERKNHSFKDGAFISLFAATHFNFKRYRDKGTVNSLLSHAYETLTPNQIDYFLELYQKKRKLFK